MRGHQAAQQINAARRANADRYERKMDAIGNRVQNNAPASEEMGCPACQETYVFGSSCPDCNVDLVSVSLMGSDPEADNAEVAVISEDRTLQLAFAAVGLAGTSLFFDPFAVFTLSGILAPFYIPHRMLSMPKHVRKHFSKPKMVAAMALAFTAAVIVVGGHLL